MNESKATRFQRNRRRRAMLGIGLAGGLMAALAWSPAGWRLAAWADSLGRAWPWPAGRVIALAAYAVTAALLWTAAAWLPARLFRSPDETAATRGGARALADAVRKGLAAAGFAFAGGATMQIGVALAGPWWWAVAGALAATVLVAAMHAGPGLIARASGARAVERPTLVEELGALARRVRVPIASIDELPASAGVTSTALVAGAGAARRVFIAHELMRDWTDDEIAVVVAHEFAHHAHHDLWRTLVTDVGVMSVGLWSAAAVLRLTAQSPDGVPGDLSALPAAALVAGVVWLATAPIRHALSRRQERRADLFALQLTNRREAFQAAIRRLAASHLAEDRPSPFARWFFHRHPTPEERLQLAESFSRRA